MKWQPIETAPKDGASVLLFARDDLPPCIGEWRRGPYGGMCWRTGQYTIIPTHWMPLPSPPEESK